MTNPNNAVGTNAAYGGRTSVNAFNDDLTIYSRGILSGWACSPKSGMTVQIGGNGSDRDAAVAEDNAGNKTSINNISGSPIDVTIPAAPATNNRIDLIVAYADNPPSGTSTVVDNPAACGIIVVSGTAASSPTAPTNAAIRSAITADGASGSTAYYVILAQIRVGTGVTTIGSGVITQGDVVKSYAAAGDETVGADAIQDGAVTSNKVDWSTLGSDELGWKYLGEKRLTSTATVIVFNLPAQYNNYKVIAAGEFASGTSNASCAFQFKRNDAEIYCSWAVANIDPSAVITGQRNSDSNQMLMEGCGQYETVNMELSSYKTASSQWRKYQGFQCKVGDNSVFRLYNGRFNSATEPNQVVCWTSGAFGSGFTVKVWGSNN